MEQFYDKHYFSPHLYGGKKYCKNGKMEEFCFGPPNHKQAFLMWERLLQKLINLIGMPESVLDVGAGTGVLVNVCTQNGIASIGLEFSEYAVNLFPEANLKLWDIEKTPWPIDKKYEWATAIDLFEHLFDCDVDTVINEMKRATTHYIIAKICTAQKNSEVWAAKKQSYPAVLEQAKNDGFEWLLASGHVNSQFPAYWLHKLEDEKWKQRVDLANEFKKNMPEDWRTTLILENTMWFDELYGR